MTPVTRQTASIHIASHTSRYDYLNAAKKNVATDDNKQQDYDQECFDGGDDVRISISTRTTRNSKLKQQQQQEQQTATITKKTKTVAFANQKQEQASAQQEEQQQQQHEQKPKGKMLSKRQAKKYDAHIEIEAAEEAANILASIALAAASASKKERTPPYWTRQHEKAKASDQRQKAMMSVLQCDYE